MRVPSALLATIAAVVLLSGCAADTDDDALTVYATTGYLADAVSNVAPEAVVTTMVGPGGDPHTYQPSTRDIQTMQASDLVLWNGLHLEAQLTDQLRSFGDRQLAVGETLPDDMLLDLAETDDEGNALHDPHVWNDPAAWSLVVQGVADKLAEVDPGNADDYRENASAYREQIAQADADAREVLQTVAAPRILVTGHDAFAYLGAAYDLDVRATDFISTEAALSAGELSDLARLIADERIPVIFHDNQASPQAITSLREAVRARGGEVEISDTELYADSLGADPGVDTYLGAFGHNVRAIAAALGTT